MTDATGSEATTGLADTGGVSTDATCSEAMTGLADTGGVSTDATGSVATASTTAGLDVIATGSTFCVFGNGGGLGIFDVFIIAGLLQTVVFSGKDGTSGGVSIGLISRMSLLIFSIFCLEGILRLL